MIDIVVVGGGGHAKVIIAALLDNSDFRVLGYTDAADGGGPILGVPRLGNDRALESFARANPGAAAVIGVGMVGSTTVRRKIEADISGLGLVLPVIKARSAVIGPEVVVAAGTFIADGVVVNPSANIGRCAILNTSCVVEHDASVGDHTHIAPGAIVCGGASIGDDCWIGAGAVIVQSVRVASGCIVAAGSVVVADLQVPGTYVGAPARKIQ